MIVKWQTKWRMQSAEILVVKITCVYLLIILPICALGLLANGTNLKLLIFFEIRTKIGILNDLK